VVEAAHAEGYLTAQYKAASEVDAARELKLYTETGLIAAVDVPRARPSLAVDQTLVAQHGLISFDSILHKHERQVMDVTLPKDPRVFVKATPAKKARSGSGANSAAASAHGSTQGSTLVSRHASPPVAVSTLVGPLGGEARPAATDAQTAAAAGATVRFSSDVKPGDATVCRPIVFAPQDSQFC
jgi:hypothetical protein